MFIIGLNPLFNWLTCGALLGWLIGWGPLPNKLIPKLFWGGGCGGWGWFTAGVEAMPKLNPRLFVGWGTGWGEEIPNPIKSAPNPPLFTGWGTGWEGVGEIDPKPNKSPPKPELGVDIGCATGCGTWGVEISSPKMLKGSLFCAWGGGVTGEGLEGWSKENPPRVLAKISWLWGSFT